MPFDPSFIRKILICVWAKALWRPFLRVKVLRWKKLNRFKSKTLRLTISLGKLGHDIVLWLVQLTILVLHSNNDFLVDEAITILIRLRTAPYILWLYGLISDLVILVFYDRYFHVFKGLTLGQKHFFYDNFFCDNVEDLYPSSLWARHRHQVLWRFHIVSTCNLPLQLNIIGFYGSIYSITF